MNDAQIERDIAKDRLWRSVDARKRFETECGFKSLADRLEDREAQQISGYWEEYSNAFHAWAEKETTPSSNVGADASRGHTPGPWSRLDLGKWQGVDIGEKASGETPCIVHWSGFDACGLPQREYAANARLIAAAPELLQSAEMLDGLCAWLLHRFGPETPEAKEAGFRLSQARAAIAKARPSHPAGDLS